MGLSKDQVAVIDIGDIVTGGTPGSMLFVDASNNLAQDNANLFWDDSNDRLGIGTASPDGKLHILETSAGSVTVTGSQANGIIIEDDDSTALTLLDPSGGVIYFGDVADTDIGRIGYRHGGDYANSMYFTTNNTQQMTIDSSGNVGIGVVEPKTALSTTFDYDTTTFESQLSDNEGGGEIMKYGSAQAGAIGTLHFLHTDGSWDQADANAVATGGSQLLGIPMGTDPGTDGMLIKGFYKVASGNIDGTPAIGAPVYVADDATGEFDFTAPAGSGDFVRIVGYCIDIDSSDILLHFDPSKTWIELS